MVAIVTTLTMVVIGPVNDPSMIVFAFVPTIRVTSLLSPFCSGSRAHIPVISGSYLGKDDIVR